MKRFQKQKLTLFHIAFVLLIASTIIYALVHAAGEAQWNSGTSISVLSGGYQSYGTLTSDGYFVIAAENSTAPAVQKYNSSGAAQWNSGSPVYISGYSNLVEIVAADSGSVLVLHSGPNVSSADTYVTKVTSAGTISWTSGPFDSVEDYWPRVIHDGSGGAYVAWYDSAEQTYITHLGSDGDVCDTATCGSDWNSGGSGTYRKLAMPTSTNGTRPEPRMTLSDSGSVIVPYTRGTLIDVVKISSSGSTVWGPTTISDSNFYYMAEPDGSNGLFVGYWHTNGTDRELKVARIDSSGSFQVGSGTGGTIVKTLDTSVRTPYSLVSASDNSGSFFLGWTESIVSTSEEVSYAQKYNTSGTEQWTTGGVQLFPTGDGLSDYFEDVYLYNVPHNLVSDGTGGVIAAVYTYGGSINSAVITQKVTSGGSLDWGSSGFFVTDDTINDYDYVQDVFSDGAGGGIVSWYQDSTRVAAQYVKTAPAPISANDGIGVSVTIPGTLTISDDNVPLSIANLTPDQVDTGETNTLTVSSNSTSGFNVAITMEDLDATQGQLCNNSSGSCGSNIFDGDGTSSYVSFTSDAGAGSMGSLAGATFTSSETKIGTASYQAFTTTDYSNTDTFDIHYDVYADNTITPDAYEGAITFTITSN